MPAQRIVLVRHARTASNATGRWQGHSDVPLDDVGVRQATLAAEVLVSSLDDVTRLVCSDLSRAVSTAAPLAAGWGLDAEQDEQLREVFAGEWEGLTKAEVGERWPDEMVGWRNGEDIVVGGGERISDAGIRVGAAITSHAEQTESGTLVVVSHGGVLRGATQHLLGLKFGQLPLVVLGNACWGVLVSGRVYPWRLEAWNIAAQGGTLSGAPEVL